MVVASLHVRGVSERAGASYGSSLENVVSAETAASTATMASGEKAVSEDIFASHAQLGPASRRVVAVSHPRSVTRANGVKR